jgi:hypothetical protein
MIFNSILNRFKQEPSPHHSPEGYEENTHGWIKCNGMDTAPGYVSLGKFDPRLLVHAIDEYRAGHPGWDCDEVELSIYNGYLLVGSPLPSIWKYMAICPRVEVDE